MSRQSDFAAKVRELIKQAREFSPQIRERVMALLEEARKRIVGEISNVDPNGYRNAQLRMLKQQIDVALDKFRTDFTFAVTSAQDKAFQLGEVSITEPLDAAGLPTSVVGISQTVLAIAQGYTADLITDMTQQAAAKLNSAIRGAFYGGQSVPDVIAQVGRAIGGDKFTGFFGPIGDRAVTVGINEILRVHSMAGQARLEDLQQQVPEMEKQWIHVPIARMPRPSHMAMNGKHVPVDQPFIVEDEELMYPRDPGGSAENTINCHCLLAPFVPADLLTPSERHKQTLKDAGIEISVSQS